MGIIRALLCIPLIGCTVYTSCPAPNQNTSGGGETGAGATNGGGNAPQGGSGPAPNVPKDPWTDQTGNLVDLESGCGNLAYVVAKPDEDLLITSVVGNGLWGSRGGSDDWEPIGTGEGSEPITNSATAFKFDPDDSKTFYEGGIYGAGIYKTTDNGETFKTVGMTSHIERFDVDFTDSDRKTLLATTHETQKVFLTTNAGETWEDITKSVPQDSGICVSVLVLDSKNFLLGCVGGIYRTDDRASTWERKLEAAATPTPFIGLNGAIYWLLSDASVVKSTDDGKTWQEIVPAGVIRGQLSELPDGRFAAAGWEYVVVSDDEGKTWTPASSPYPYKWESAFFTYSATRKAFYVWRNDCGARVPDKALQYYSFDYEK